MNIIKFSNAERVDVGKLLTESQLPPEFHGVGAIALRAAFSSEGITHTAGRQVCELLLAAGGLLADLRMLMPEGAEKVATTHHPGIPRYTFTRRLDTPLGTAFAHHLEPPVIAAEGCTVQTISLAYSEKTAQPDVPRPDQYVLAMRADLGTDIPFDGVASTLTLTTGQSYSTMTLAKNWLLAGDAMLEQYDPPFAELRYWRLALMGDPLLGVPLQREASQ